MKIRICMFYSHKATDIHLGMNAQLNTLDTGAHLCKSTNFCESPPKLDAIVLNSI